MSVCVSVCGREVYVLPYTITKGLRCVALSSPTLRRPPPSPGGGRAHVDANNLLRRRRRRRRAPSPPRRTVVWQGRLCGLEVQQGARVQQPTQRALEVLDVARVVGQRADGVPMRRGREATSWLWTTDGGQ